jgi:hypothetical protein
MSFDSGGNPKLDHNHPLSRLYNQGVRFGSWGMSVYSISCSIYSYNIQSLNNYFGLFVSLDSDYIPWTRSFSSSSSFSWLNQGIKRVYIGSQVIYAIGMLLMGYLRNRIAVIVLSAVAGILYSTLFTIPYLLISKYHTSTTVNSFVFSCIMSCFCFFFFFEKKWSVCIRWHLSSSNKDPRELQPSIYVASVQM